ncbi:MAG TPA: response regulator [Gemmatimonadaceae bacterium]|nr:response regulator [Gemmatimonadaceae bacterium]
MSTILYVDDEAAIQRAIRSLLSRKGHTVLTAGSIAEARGVLAANAVDGALIDLWLGPESGFDLLEWIDMHQPHLLTRVAVVTGEVIFEPETQRMLDLYQRPVLSKPFDMTELERLIAGWSAT